MKIVSQKSFKNGIGSVGGILTVRSSETIQQNPFTSVKKYYILAKSNLYVVFILRYVYNSNWIKITIELSCLLRQNLLQKGNYCRKMIL